MPSGGARARSGPAPDPNALRRDRKSDGEWTTLPREGYRGRIPTFPLGRPTDPLMRIRRTGEDLEDRIRDAIDEIDFRIDAEKKLWRELWRKPQAVMWERLGMKYQVAAYVRAYLESISEASAGLKTAVLRMEAELGLSVPGMHSLRWRIAEDEVAARRDVEGTTGRSDVRTARSRLKALDAG